MKPPHSYYHNCLLLMQRDLSSYRISDKYTVSAIHNSRGGGVPHLFLLHAAEVKRWCASADVFFALIYIWGTSGLHLALAL